MHCIVRYRVGFNNMYMKIKSQSKVTSMRKASSNSSGKCYPRHLLSILNGENLDTGKFLGHPVGFQLMPERSLLYG